jgi:two-component system CheB/CheR fusion protein
MSQAKRTPQKPSSRKKSNEKPAANAMPAASGKVQIVAIGASAGGLAALQVFFDHVPADTGLAFVVVVHLSPAHDSYLAELLQPHAAIPVTQVSTSVSLEANHIYIIPPGSFLDAVDTQLRVVPPSKRLNEQGAVDHFFRSLASAQDGNATGVILTGTGSDGTLGIKAIKENGGTAIVQDPEEAEYDGMPRNAIATGLVDLILPLSQIPAEIIRITKVKPVIAVSDVGEKIEAEEKLLLQKLFAQINVRTQRDFSRYKPSTIIRRIQRRMQLKQVETLPEYLRILREQPEELSSLADDLLINVTNFFRDPEVYQVLEQKVIAELFAGKNSSDQIRAWSVGCATGEEAYSVAILLLEAAARLDTPPQFQIFASDLHEPSLKLAREGFYTGNLEADVTAERLKRFFRKANDGYRVLNEVRDRIVFAQHNVLGDPPFSKLDLIVCRNLLIYLERGVQREVIALFHYALNPGGILILGRSETIDENGELFHAEDKPHGIYRKRNTPAREPRLPVFAATRPRPLAALAGEQRSNARDEGSYGAVHQLIVEQYGPPSILAGWDHRILHVSKHAARYLKFPGGQPSFSIFEVVREELRLVLLAALHEAERSASTIRTKPVNVQIDGLKREVWIDVRAVEAHDEAHGLLLIMFDERDETGASQAVELAPNVRDGIIQELQGQLDVSQHRLRVIVEDYETSQEEMKTSNEELQSSNEELRSTMEELETSREELQSINEELTTVNQENRHKVDELNLLTSDLQNLMVATEIPTLFLDRALRILRFTPRLGEIFNIRNSDRSRPVSDLTHRLDYLTLTNDARQVLEQLLPIEREVRDDAQRWYVARLLPYRSLEDRIGGVVVTFVDITAQKRAIQEAVESKKHAESIVNTIKEPLLVLTPDLRTHSANLAFYDEFKIKPDEVVGRLFYALGEGQFDIPQLRNLLEAVLPRNVAFEDFQIVYRSIVLGERLILVNGRRLGEENLILLGFQDVTGLKTVELALREADRRKDEFLATLAHELRNPLAAIYNALAVQKIAGLGDTVPVLTHEILERQTQQLVRLVDDLLDVARITHGKVELRKQKLDLVAIVRSALEISAPAIEAAGCELHTDLAAEPLLINADQVRMTQIISNLLNNATKYTPKGGTISVTLAQKQNQASLTIRDTGIGIAADFLPRIFDLFVQVDGPDTKDHRGLGIGLTLVRNLIELHGGDIEAKSEGFGKGSEFIIHFPLLSAAGETNTFATVPVNGASDSLAPALRVLVVDDDRDSGDSLALLLRLQGHEVDVVYDGATALASMAANPPALALIDIGMPSMDGYEVARRVRQTPFKHVILVALTGWGQEKDRRLSAEAGFDHHLVKPASRESLNSLFASIQSLREKRVS